MKKVLFAVSFGLLLLLSGPNGDALAVEDGDGGGTVAYKTGLIDGKNMTSEDVLVGFDIPIRTVEMFIHERIVITVSIGISVSGGLNPSPFYPSIVRYTDGEKCNGQAEIRKNGESYEAYLSNPTQWEGSKGEVPECLGQSGEWGVSTLIIRDSNGESFVYESQDLLEMGFDPHFTVLVLGSNPIYMPWVSRHSD